MGLAVWIVMVRALMVLVTGVLLMVLGVRPLIKQRGTAQQPVEVAVIGA